MVADVSDADPTDFTRDLVRWSETLAAIARTGLGFTQNLYERERFEEVLHVAADIKWAADEALEDLDDVLALARHPNLAIKLTGMCSYSTQGFPFADLHEPIARVVDAFGVDRCLWGTDWQRSTLLHTYDEASDTFTAIFGQPVPAATIDR